MQKFLKPLIILVIALFIGAGNTYANVAGDSANLNLRAKFDQNELSTISLNRKKLAIRAVLERYQSPISGKESSFISTCQKYNLDCYLLPSIAGLESTFGRFIWPESFNPFGWDRGYMMFDDWSQAIDTVGYGLRKGYLNRGALSVYEIGPIYSESPTWAVRVAWFMEEFKKEEAKLTLLSTEIPVKL